MIDEPSTGGSGSTPRPTGPDPADERADLDPGAARLGWANRRRERIVAEIQRNRRGEYKVPTWVLVVILLAIVAAWAALIIFS